PPAISTLSLHDALPISRPPPQAGEVMELCRRALVARFQRQLHGLLALRGEVERLGQHQIAVGLGGGGGLRRQAERDAVEPGVGRSEEHTSELQSLAYLV